MPRLPPPSRSEAMAALDYTYTAILKLLGKRLGRGTKTELESLRAKLAMLLNRHDGRRR